MKCGTIHNLLSPYLEGELEGARAKEVEEHLRGCERCRRALDDLRLIVSQAENLAQVTLANDLWPAIESTLLDVPEPTPAKRPHPAPLSGWRPRIAWALSVASVFTILFLLRYHILPQKPDFPASQSLTQPSTSTSTDIDQVRRHYQNSILTLEQIVAHRAHEMNPEHIALYQEKLDHLEEAIRECSIALERNSYDMKAQRALFDTYDRKISALREMAVSAAY